MRSCVGPIPTSPLISSISNTPLTKPSLQYSIQLSLCVAMLRQRGLAVEEAFLVQLHAQRAEADVVRAAPMPQLAQAVLQQAAAAADPSHRRQGPGR